MYIVYLRIRLQYVTKRILNVFSSCHAKTHATLPVRTPTARLRFWGDAVLSLESSLRMRGNQEWAYSCFRSQSAMKRGRCRFRHHSRLRHTQWQSEGRGSALGPGCWTLTLVHLICYIHIVLIIWYITLELCVYDFIYIMFVLPNFLIIIKFS